MNGAPQLFFPVCARAVVALAQRARARHPAARRAKKSTGAGYVPARGANSFACRCLANELCVLAPRFFRAGREEFVDRQRGARAGGAGPCQFVFCGRALQGQAGGQLGTCTANHEGKSQNSPCPTSRPPLAPRQASLRLEPTRAAHRRRAAQLPALAPGNAGSVVDCRYHSVH